MKVALLPILFLLVSCGRFDTTSDLISKIAFKLHADKKDKDVFSDGIIPWISLDTPVNQIDSLIDADEIVLQYNKVTLVIDYPLSNKATFNIESEGRGFSRKQLIKAISEKYHEVYKDEENTARHNMEPEDKVKRIANRNQTNGIYGICCHDLADLNLSYVEVHKNFFGKIFLILDIES